MITDALLAPLRWVLELVDAALPDGKPIEATAFGGVVESLSVLNAFVPVAEFLAIAVGLMGLVGAFMLARFILLVRHTLLP